jgi:D-alanyl-D-alanine dipeptidase
VAGSRRAEILRLVLAFLMLALAASSTANAQPRHPGFVDVVDAVPGVVVDMRYFGEQNFIGRRVEGYEAPRCLLTVQAATALAQVQRDLAPGGIGLKVFDCYRPERAVAHFVRWARNIADQSRKAEFYPQVDKQTLFRDGYISVRSGHSRGSTVDLTLVSLRDGGELDMGTPFDFFDRRSWLSDRTISAGAMANRRLLGTAMQRRGFYGYAKEWWHFTLANEPFRETYFDFPVR